MFVISESAFEIIGIMTVVYAICRGFRLWTLFLEDRNKDHGFFFWVLMVCRIICAFLSLPVLIVFTFFENATVFRIEKRRDKE